MACSIIRTGVAGAIALLLFLSATGPVQAQDTGTIVGEVVNAETNRPLAGVQVLVAGTRIGGLTGPNGRFVLTNVPAGSHTVRLQLIGFRTVERDVTVSGGQTAVANFQMSETAIALEEIVVTGSGVATERRKLGNTIASIGTEKIENAPVTSFSEILQGREPGVVGLPSGGLTGEGTRIRIRGNNSLAMSNQPIIYLNGVRIDNTGGLGIGTGGGGQPSRLDDIDPSSIERIEILKGAAAATLYGSEASGGVIQIFTKSGARAGAPTRWEVQVEQAVLQYPDAFKPLAGFARDADHADAINEFWGLNVRPYEVFEVDPLGRLLETGHRQVYSASLSGGTDVLSYYGSLRHQDEDGPVGYEAFARARDENRKMQGTLNLTAYPRDDLEISVRSLYTDGVHRTLNNNNNIYAPFTLAMFGKPEWAECYGIVAETGEPSQPLGNGTCTGQGNEFGVLAFGTVRETMQRSFEQEVQHYTGSVQGTYRPAGNVAVTTILGVDLVNEHSSLFYPFGWDVDDFTTNNPDGARVLVDRNKRQLSLDTRGSWDARLGTDWTSQLVIGTQGFITRTQTQWADVRDFPGPGFEVVSAAATIGEAGENFTSVVNAGLLAQEQIGWRDWVFTTLGGRFDWNSAFGENEPGAFYPKASLSVAPSSRDAWNSELLSTFRVRAAVGQSGLQPGAFDRLTTYSAIRSEFGGGVQPANLGNPDLKPEVATEWEVGADMGLFRDRASFEVTYWDRTVRDALVSRQFPVTGGFLQQQLVNLGRLDGNGLEVALSGSPYQSRSVSVELFANAAYLQEKVVDLGEAPALKVGGSYTRYRNWIREGHAPGAFFGPELDTSAQFPIDLDGDCQAESQAELLAYFSEPRAATTTAIRPLVRDCEGDFLGRYLGKPMPDWQGSFGGSVDFGAFSLSTLLEYKWGNFFVHNLTDGFRRAHPALGGNLRGVQEVKAVLENPESTAEQRLAAADEYVREWAALAPFDGLHEIEKADFIRWREVQLRYRVPPEWVQRWGMNSLTLSVGGRNLGFLHNKYSGTDPEVNLLGANSAGGLDDYANGIDAFGFPLPRQFTFAARASF